jgi:DNA-directed RNA polymerase sigma subunit (sigma70/sigma32)
VIQLRFGTGGEPEKSVRDVARQLGVSQQQARQLEASGLRRLASSGSLAAWRAAA